MKVAQAFAEAAVVALPNEDGCAAGVAALPERLVDALCRFPIGSVRGKQSLKKDASQRAEEQKYRRTRREIQMPTPIALNLCGSRTVFKRGFGCMPVLLLVYGMLFDIIELRVLSRL